MRLKKFFDFINESVNSDMYWVSEENIKDIFQSLIDEGFSIEHLKYLLDIPDGQMVII